MEKMRIALDMDGTFVDLYGVENWLEYLMNEDTTPYEIAKPLVSMTGLARVLNNLQKQGWEIGIISWTSKNGSRAYNKKVKEAKEAWLAKHLPSVEWDRVTIVPYGTPKENYCNNDKDVLFDDEAKNRENWKGRAYDVQDVLATLKALSEAQSR